MYKWNRIYSSNDEKLQSCEESEQNDVYVEKFRGLMLTKPSRLFRQWYWFLHSSRIFVWRNCWCIFSFIYRWCSRTVDDIMTLKITYNLVHVVVNLHQCYNYETLARCHLIILYVQFSQKEIDQLCFKKQVLFSYLLFCVMFICTLFK